MSRHVFFVAAEESGDALGADVIDALRSADPDVRVSGVGLQRIGERSNAVDVDLSGLAILGLFDGLKILPRLRRAVYATADAIMNAKPDAVVLIDSWGFMIRVASVLKQRGCQSILIKLIGPQVWATRAGRAKKLAQVCDHLLCIHAFELPFYERAGLPATVIGNPAISRMPRGDGSAFREKYGIPQEMQLIGLLPGSRGSEIRRVAPVLEAACRPLCEGDEHRNRTIVCIVAPSVEASVRERARSWRFPYIIVADEGDKANAFAAMNVALTCSGTVTTELAVQGAPIVVGYKLGWTTWAVARLFLMRSRFITLLNVAAGREVAPEFVQTRLTPGNIARAAEGLLANPSSAAEQSEAQTVALNSMTQKGRPAAYIAAETIIQLT